jgi:hypothetical protein
MGGGIPFVRRSNFQVGFQLSAFVGGIAVDCIAIAPKRRLFVSTALASLERLGRVKHTRFTRSAVAFLIEPSSPGLGLCSARTDYRRDYWLVTGGTVAGRHQQPWGSSPQRASSGPNFSCCLRRWGSSKYAFSPALMSRAPGHWAQSS